MPEPTDLIHDRLDAAIGAPPPAPLDTEALLGRARRAQARRRLALGAGTATAAVVVGGVAWAATPGGSSDGVDRVPVAGSPSASSAPESPQSPPERERTPKSDGRWAGVPRDDLVAFAGDGTLEPVGRTRLVEQRTGVDLGSFAPAAGTAVAEVVADDGSRWYLVARRSSDPRYIAVPAAKGGADLDAFLDLARARYAEGGGGLL